MTNSAHLDSRRDTLKADATILIYLGGPSVYVGYRQESMKIPSIVLTHSDDGQPRAGYDARKVREHLGIFTIRMGVKTTVLDADHIAERVDELMMPGPITSTWGWAKVSESETAWDETVNAYQKVIRYSYRYQITDT